MWNFDEVVDRENSSCIKYDFREEVFGRADVIPMWVADMDFRTPSFITGALTARLQHEILGYSYRPDSYFTAMIRWIAQRHNWEVRREWTEFSPGVVPALNMCTLAFTEPGDEIIIQPPVVRSFSCSS